MSRVSAEADLRWYYGSGPDSWQGDAGLRSNFGSQLQAAYEGRTTSHGVDISEIEDRAIERCSHAAKATDIEARLRCLTRAQVGRLEAHFKGRSLPYEISAAAVFCEHAKTICASKKRPPIERLRAALMALRVSTHRDVQGLVFESELMVSDLLRCYSETSITPTRRIQDARQSRDRTSREVGVS